MSASLMSLAPLETLFYIDVITASIAIVILYCLVKVPAISRTMKIPKRSRISGN